MQEVIPRHYAWFDTEFTSLDLDKAKLIQLALVVSDADLQPIAPESPPQRLPEGCRMANGINLYLPLPEDWTPEPFHLEHMGSVLERCRESRITLEQADAALAAWVDACVGEVQDEIARRPILAGNSIHNDWLLVRRDLPRFHSRLHYRLLDASGFKSEWLACLGGGEALLDKEDHQALRALFPGIEIEAGAHDAYFDAQASLAEMAWYREHLRPGRDGTCP